MELPSKFSPDLQIHELELCPGKLTMWSQVRNLWVNSEVFPHRAVWFKTHFLRVELA